MKVKANLVGFQGVMPQYSMCMNSLPILVQSDLNRFMVQQLKKLYLLSKILWRALGQLFSDLRVPPINSCYQVNPKICATIALSTDFCSKISLKRSVSVVFDTPVS